MARSAAARMADHLSGEDQTVPRSVVDNLPKGATEDFLVAPPNAKDVTPTVEALPEPTSVAAVLAEAAERAKAKQSADRRAARAATVKAAAKPKAAAKAVKPKAKVDRVPAADVVALIDELKITRTQFGQAIGVGPSMVSEFVGRGRGNLMARPRWHEAQRKARAFAKGLK